MYSGGDPEMADSQIFGEFEFSDKTIRAGKCFRCLCNFHYVTEHAYVHYTFFLTGFIRKVYVILMVQLLVTFGAICLFIYE